jgi:hypothetical protein
MRLEVGGLQNSRRLRLRFRLSGGRWILVEHEAQPLKAFSLQSIYLSSLEGGGSAKRG